MQGWGPWQLLYKQAGRGSIRGRCLSLLQLTSPCSAVLVLLRPHRTHRHTCTLTPETAHDKAEPPILWSWKPQQHLSSHPLVPSPVANTHVQKGIPVCKEPWSGAASSPDPYCGELNQKRRAGRRETGFPVCLLSPQGKAHALRPPPVASAPPLF